MSTKIKTTVGGRFWKNPDGDGYIGYLDFGVFGRIDARIFPQQKEYETDCDLVLSLSIQSTPFGIMKAMIINLEKDKVDENKPK